MTVNLGYRNCLTLYIPGFSSNTQVTEEKGNSGKAYLEVPTPKPIHPPTTHLYKKSRPVPISTQSKPTPKPPHSNQLGDTPPAYSPLPEELVVGYLTKAFSRVPTKNEVDRLKRYISEADLQKRYVSKPKESFALSQTSNGHAES